MTADRDDEAPEPGTEVDAAARIAAAEAAVAAMGADYLTWLREDLEALAANRASLAEPSTEAAALEEIFVLTHNIKGQAGAFGFALIGEVAGLLCEFTRARAALDPAGHTAVGRGLSVLDRLAAAGVAGDGGGEGAALLADLAPILRRPDAL
jgi:chemotaxis protein histidine kinase CheA